jgi:hypothetical protein
MSKSINIPVHVQVKFWENLGMWEVIDSIDKRNDDRLGNLTSYGFDHSSTLMEQILTGVIDAVLSKEQLEGDVAYVISMTVFEDGKEIGSRSKSFAGNCPPEIPKNWRVAHKKDVFKFLPYEDKDCVIVETAQDYAGRMKNSALPNFPEEVLVEWFHRQPCVIEEYAFLDYETLQFERQTWATNALPGRGAFTAGSTFDQLIRVFELRLKNHNWLAEYMNDHGTWNTPIILIDNSSGSLRFPSGERLKKPYHLLEGHTRLSFFWALRNSGKLRSEHHVWIARER